MSLGRGALLLALFIGVGCTPSPQPSTAPSPTETPAPPVGNLPPGCEPIDLRSPAGVRINLDGTWIEIEPSGEPMTWWIRTSGDCVWGAGYIEDVSQEGTFEARPDHVQSLAGHIGSDFVITGEIVLLGAFSSMFPVVLPRHTPLRLLIEIDDAGEILLHEDRQAGVTGPRCPDPGGYCLAPLLLQRAN